MAILFIRSQSVSGEDAIVNLNGKTYTWKKQTREWIFVEPNHHQETLRLAMKFNELTGLEANYQLNHHEFYQRQEIERINAINELMTRIHVRYWNAINYSGGSNLYFL